MGIIDRMSAKLIEKKNKLEGRPEPGCYKTKQFAKRSSTCMSCRWYSPCMEYFMKKIHRKLVGI